MIDLDRDQVAQILAAHGIVLETLEKPRQGMINQTLIVNQTYVLRVDTYLPDVIPSRYLGEARAYTRLHEIGLPVPQVIALDVSRTIAPLPYIILSRLPGAPLAHSWKTMTPEQQASFARRSGALMAQMHEVTMEAYGWLSNLDTNPLSSASELTESFFYLHLNTGSQRKTFDEALCARIIALWERIKPLIAEVKRPHLIHRDFHFENILVQGDEITGLIDFEWGAVGDPAWDFMVDLEREWQCPGSRSYLYEGYQSKRALPDHLPILSRFYMFLLELDLTANAFAAAGEKPNASRVRMLALLNTLEAETF